MLEERFKLPAGKLTGPHYSRRILLSAFIAD
jgi:hypothetical protein